MADSTLDFILQQRKEAEERRSRLPFEQYRRNLLQQVAAKTPVTAQTIMPPRPRADGTYVCLREPVEFLRLFEDISNSQEACRKRFADLLARKDGRVVAQVIRREDIHTDMWFSSTAAGINLRPGYENNERTKPTVTAFGKPDDNVHALIVGATGSGKSVFLHNLLFSMMLEYAPWELNLYLIDFKKVSLSKYLSDCETPHVKAVAATSEVRYVVSLLDHLNRCMRARQTFFSLIGLEKLEQLRTRYEVILPRAVLLVDEFQQMFSDATQSETLRIQEILTSITKLGRATGYHLIFASQEMTGTLGASAFANFKVRFALRCTADVSSQFLGNAAASRIGARERGIVIENSVDGHEENNRTYKVPFIEEEGDVFGSFLREQTDLAAQAGYETVHKYYQEDFMKRFEVLEELLADSRVRVQKEKLLASVPGLTDILTLGDAVVFNYKRNDYETVFLESGVKRNIGVFTPKAGDAAYLCRLLAANFKASPHADRYHHAAVIMNDMITRNYDLAADLGISAEDIFRTEEDLSDRVMTLVRQRKEVMSLLQSYREGMDLGEFALASFRLTASYGLPEEERRQITERQGQNPSVIEEMSYFFAGRSPEEIPQAEAELQAAMAADSSEWVFILTLLYRMQCEGCSRTELFEPCVFWVLGTEMLERFSGKNERLLAEASHMGMLFIVAATALTETFSTVFGSCEYLFVSGNLEKVYHALNMPYTRKAEDSIVIDCMVRSAGVMRSFKKFLTEETEKGLPELDFDSLLA